MDFELSDEQRQLQAAIREVGDSCRRRGLARAGEATPEGYPEQLNEDLRQVGLQELLVAERLGGSGQTVFEVALVAEELGRAAISTPLLSQAWGAQVALSACGSPRADELLGESVSSPRILTLAHLEATMYDEWVPPATQLAETDGRLVLHGAKILVPYANAARAALVTAIADGELLLCYTRLDENASRLERHFATGGDPLFRYDVDGVQVSAADVLARGEQALSALRKALDAGTVSELAYGFGLGQQALSMTTEYATARHQFGQPIGSFQAISHRCVDMLADLEPLRVLTRRAAWELSYGDTKTQAEAVAVAKSFGDPALSRIFINAHQVHGAIGFSAEHDLQLFSRRAKAIELSLGGSSRHLGRLADCL